MQVKSTSEWQFDGLVGPTHNYAGLAHGNLASASNAGAISNPKAAALQGLAKMRFVRDLGVPQAFLPPQKRPNIAVLQSLGFGAGTSKNAIVHSIDTAYRTAPELLAAVFSSSFMWAANAATVTPSADAADGKLHLTSANLISHFHRAIEAEDTTQLLQRIFPDRAHVEIHPPLPATLRFSDEGAANHMHLQGTANAAHVFVYGAGQGGRFAARQQRGASEAIARRHGVQHAVYWQQNPAAIDAGVFHNDVIAMSSHQLLIAHEKAYVDQAQCLAQLQKHLGDGFTCIDIPETMLSLKEAVASYLFNSQLLYLNDQYMLVAPKECETSPQAQRAIAFLTEEKKAIHAVHYRDVRESMRNGGGPACLRLRVPMTDAESASMHQGVILTDTKYDLLKNWIHQHYRDRLTFDDFRDPNFLDELDAAHAALEGIVGIKGFYTH